MIILVLIYLADFCQYFHRGNACILSFIIIAYRFIYKQQKVSEIKDILGHYFLHVLPGPSVSELSQKPT